MSAAEGFRKLLDREWQHRLERSPEFASTLGDRRWNDRWSNRSLEALETEHRRRQTVLAELAGIDRAALSPADRINYDLFRRRLSEDIEQWRFGWHLVPLTQRGGLQTLDDFGRRLRFQTVKDYEDWIARLRSFGEPAKQTEALMREGMRRRVLLPKVVLDRVPAQIDKQIVARAEDSGFYEPFRRFPASIPPADQQRLREQAAAAIANTVIPAFRGFREFFVREYLPASFDRVGVWQLPEGGRFYESLVREYTTTNLTPKEIHETGLAEVARIRAAMEAIKAKTGFQGPLKEFFHFLRTDPRFYYKSGEELLDAYRAMTKRVDPLLVRIFRTLPRTPYGVEPIPMNIAPDTTTAYYFPPAADGSRAGTYFVNLYKPETRPKWEMMALSIHEAVPGHHLQIALANEQGELPPFRRYGFFTAFVEGWGLYSETLGDDLGLYDDPYSKFGHLTYEMWRAVRLVVDTGIHYYQWDRQKAIDYFLENAPKTELDVVNEIDRYISMPGQAVAYKIGELKLKELRARATRELGSRFDLRDFHEVVLGAGAIPLDVLEQRVNAWMAERKAAVGR